MASPFEPTSFARGLGGAASGARTCDARVFGSFRVVASDGLDVTPGGRKARALIAYLVLADGEAVTRDRLAGLLWSERGDDQARASLRQTLYEMRALTSGDEPLVTIDRAQARIETGRVVTDLDRARRAAAVADTATIAALIGDKPSALLTDLDGVDTAFDEWLSVERTRRGDERRRIVLSAAEAALAAGDSDGAHRLAVRLLAADPTDETMVRLAMEASHRRGDRDAVRQLFVRLQNALRQDLAVAPSDETVALNRRLMGAQMPARATVASESTGAVEAANDDPMREVGGRMPVAEPATVGDVAPEVGVRGAPPPASGRSMSRSLRRLAMPALFASLVVLVGGGSAWWRAATRSPQRTLTVDPFRVAPTDLAALPLRNGFAADLAHLLLGNDTRLSVIDSTHPTNAAARGTDFVVAGDVQSAGPMLHVDLKLMRAHEDTILWSGSVTRPAVEIDALREQMAAKVADVAVCALGATTSRLEDFRTETIRLLLGACEEKHGDWNESARLLQQVVALQPDFAHGWAMLSAATAVSAYQMAGDAAAQGAKADAYAQKALALDPREGEAYFARATVLSGLDRWIARMAMLEAGRRVEPNNAAIDATIASNLARVGRLQEAIGFSRRAVDADPFSAEKAAQRARLLGLAGAIPAADIALQAAHRRFASNRAVALADFRVAALVGDTSRATAILANPERGFILQPDRIRMWNALIAARAAPSPAARDAAYEAFVASMRVHPEINIDVVEKLAVLQRVDEAYADAERITADPGALRNVPDMETLFSTATAPLRAEPRFMTLAARLGLVAIWQQTDHWPDFCGDRSVGYDCKAEATRATSPDARPLVAGASR